MSITPLGDPGLIIDRGYVEKNVLDHVRKWMIPYLANQERYQDPPITPRSLTVPKSYDVVTEFTRFPQNSLPFIGVVSTGLVPESIKREGDGWVTMSWAIAVGAVVSAKDARSSKNLAGYYGAAIRGIMTDMPQLGGWAAYTDMQDEQYDDYARAQEDQLAAARLVFEVEVQGVMNYFLGFRGFDGEFVVPDDPYATPLQYPIVPDADHISVEIDQVGPNETLPEE